LHDGRWCRTTSAAMTASGAKARLLACRTWRIRSVVSTQISRSSRQAGCTGTPAVHGQVRVCVWSTVGGCEFTSWSWCTGRSLRTSFEPGVAGGSSEGGGRCGKLCGLRAPSEQSLRSKPVHSQVKSIHKQKSTTIRKPIECAPEASRGGREWAEMTEGVHLEVTRHKC